MDNNNEFKNCPYCDEEIKSIAVKCRYCKSMLIGKDDNHINPTPVNTREYNDNFKVTGNEKQNVNDVISKQPPTQKKKASVHWGWFLAIGVPLIVMVYSSANNDNNERHSNSFNDSISQEAVKGNSTSNINNGGLVAIHDNWIYYSNFDSKSLSRVNEDENTVETIYNNYENGSIASINVANGWIYFSDYEGIFRIRSDGSGLDNIVANVNSDKTLSIASDVNVIGDWIYYTNTQYYIKSEDPIDIKSEGEICKVRIDGTEHTVIVNDEATNLNVIDDWIIYCNNYDDSMIYKIRIDGSKRKKIINEKAKFVTVVNNNIYYINSADGNIYRVGIEGNDLTKIIDGDIWSFNIDNDWLYYCDADSYGIFRVKLDGGEFQRLINKVSWKIFVVGEWLYYLNVESFNLKKVRLEGSEGLSNVVTSDIVTGEAESNEGISSSGSANYDYLVGKIVIVNTADGNPLVLKSRPHHDSLEANRIAGGARLENGTELFVADVVENEWLIVKSTSVEYTHGGGFVNVADVILKEEVYEYDNSVRIAYVDGSKTDSERLNLRSGPGKDYDVVDKLNPETELRVIFEVTGSDGDNWLKVVTLDGKEGWVHGGYIRWLLPQ